MDCEGAICDITARSHGMSAKFSVKVANIDQGKSIDLDLTGELIGTERWTFEPMEGKTKVQIRWNGATNRLLFSILSPFASAGKVHSESLQKGLKVLNNSLAKK